MHQDSVTTPEDVESAGVPDWGDSEYLVMNDFQDLASRRIELKLERDHIDRQIEALNQELAGMLTTAEMKSVRFGIHRLTLRYSVSGGYLSKEKLLESGVTAQQIARATSAKVRGKAYISVNEVKGAED